MALPLLKVVCLSKRSRKKKILDSFSLEIYPSEIVSLIGPNGAGKTTAFHLIMGIIRPDQGEIYLESQALSRLSIDKRAQSGIGYLSQEPSIFRSLTVEENLLLALDLLPLSTKEKRRELDRILDQFQLTSLRKSLSQLLSGGERRRLEIGRTLIQKPKILLMDEPFAAVDPLTILDLKELILQLKKEGISFLITDHNVRELFSFADRHYLLQKGVLTHSGTSHDLITNPEVISSYLGKDFLHSIKTS